MLLCQAKEKINVVMTLIVAPTDATRRNVSYFKHKYLVLIFFLLFLIPEGATNVEESSQAQGEGKSSRVFQ